MLNIATVADSSCALIERASALNALTEESDSIPQAALIGFAPKLPIIPKNSEIPTLASVTALSTTAISFGRYSAGQPFT